MSESKSVTKTTTMKLVVIKLILMLWCSPTTGWVGVHVSFVTIIASRSLSLSFQAEGSFFLFFNASFLISWACPREKNVRDYFLLVSYSRSRNIIIMMPG